MMDHHDVREPDEVIEGKYVVQRGRRVSAHVAKYYSFWGAFSGLTGPDSPVLDDEKPDIPAGRSPKNCSGIQRGSAQVTAGKLAGGSEGWRRLGRRTDDDVW